MSALRRCVYSSGSELEIIPTSEDPIADAHQAGSELNRIDNGNEDLFSRYDALQL